MYGQWLFFNLSTHKALFDKKAKKDLHWFWAVNPRMSGEGQAGYEPMSGVDKKDGADSEAAPTDDDDDDGPRLCLHHARHRNGSCRLPLRLARGIYQPCV